MKFELPKNWEGAVKDTFFYWLFSRGYIAIFNDPKYGYIFQPCTLSGRNVFYLPTTALISNPDIPEFKNSKLEIGSDCEILKLTPDYQGIFDIITYYSEELSNLKGDFDMATVNAKISYILGSKTRAAGEALKKILDNVNKGNPSVVYDQRIANDQADKDIPFQFLELPSDKAVSSLEPINESIQNVLNNFDAEIGIPTLSYKKKERMVTSEAESKIIDSTSRSIVWFETLKSSINIINSHFSDQEPISVELRYDPEKIEEENEKGDSINE